jgi:site-specific DNA-cytosine methylase
LVAQPIAVDCYNQTINEKTTQTIGSSASDVNHYGAVLTPTIIDRAAFNQGANAQYAIKIEEGQTMSSLVAKGPHGVGQYNPPTMAIRRLTPRECERLQGFPDDWTLIPYRNKSVEQCPDGPRYKACGNSMAVPVMRWIGQRIQMVKQLMKEVK